jgi:hypothetical protein
MKATIITKATRQAVVAISLFFFCVCPSVSLIKMGTLVIGFMIAKNAVKTVSI